MGCINSSPAIKPLFQSVSKDTVSDLLSKSSKCTCCKKGYGHSFTSVSTCALCNMMAHTKCVVNLDECPGCNKEPNTKN